MEEIILFLLLIMCAAKQLNSMWRIKKRDIRKEVNAMANFIVQFPLKTELYQEDVLDRRFETGRKIYNSLVHITQNRYKEMRLICTKINNDEIIIAADSCLNMNNGNKINIQKIFYDKAKSLVIANAEDIKSDKGGGDIHWKTKIWNRKI